MQRVSENPPVPTSKPVLNHKIAVLVFIQNTVGEQLLLLRAKSPNKGTWSPIGGKLEVNTGESPFECAIRETHEETGLKVGTEDLHMFGMISEKAYEGNSHWLLFLFQLRVKITSLPPTISEGHFGFFSRQAINDLPLPETDRNALWSIYDKYHQKFVALRADCHPSTPLQIAIEQITPSDS